MPFSKEVLLEGSGDTPKRGQTVTVHCTGMGKNNDLTQKFWSTKDPGASFLQSTTSQRRASIAIAKELTRWTPCPPTHVQARFLSRSRLAWAR